MAGKSRRPRKARPIDKERVVKSVVDPIEVVDPEPEPDFPAIEEPDDFGDDLDGSESIRVKNVSLHRYEFGEFNLDAGEDAMVPDDLTIAEMKRIEHAMSFGHLKAV